MQRQRIATKIDFEVRDLVPADLAALRPEAGRADLSTPQQFRDTHHRIARLVASGLRLTEVAERTGFSYGRVTMLSKSPAFQSLVDFYREKVAEAFVQAELDFHADATRVRTKALRHVEEHFDRADEADEIVPLRLALATVEATADRTGYGKQSTKFNVNTDFAKALEQAYVAQARVIESRAQPPRTVAEHPPILAPRSAALLDPSAAEHTTSARPVAEVPPRAPVAGVAVERGADQFAMRRRA
jgi:hypothetical protein